MSDQSVRVVARIVARPEKVEELKALLLKLVEATRQETGCVKYELLQNQTEPTDFTFVEEWASDNALNAHMKSAHMEAISAQLDGLVAGEDDIRRYRLLAQVAGLGDHP